MNRTPDKIYEIPLWQENHSMERLIMEERSDWMAFKLGYQMQPTATDPDKMAYKYFSDDQYPEGNVTEMDYIKSAKVALMCDFNRNPQSAALGQKQGEKYIVFDQIISKNALSSEQGQNIANKLQNWNIKHVYLYGDNTSNQKTGSYGRTGKNDWEYIKEALQEAGITFTSKLRKSNPKRKVRVDKVNNLIYNVATHERRLLLHERCEWIIQDYMQSVTDDDGIKVDSGMIGHASDSVDYWIYESEIGGGMPIYVM